MLLPPEEPEASGWEVLDEPALASRLGALLPAGRALVLVDGRSGGGKSTAAARIASALGGAVVHTDDVAWHLHPIDWADALRDGVLRPWRAGESVSYRPPGWVARGRPGAVEVPACEVLVVEGVGAGRAELAAEADLVVWVQSDAAEARRRGIARDIAEGRPAGEADGFWDDWQRSEDPFLAADQPWTRAALVVNGTPGAAGAAEPVDGTLVAAGPLLSPTQW